MNLDNQAEAGEDQNLEIIVTGEEIDETQAATDQKAAELKSRVKAAKKTSPGPPADASNPEPTEADLLAELIARAGLTTAEERAHLKRFISDTATSKKEDTAFVIKTALDRYDQFASAFLDWSKKQQPPADPPPASTGQTTEAAAGSEKSASGATSVGTALMSNVDTVSQICYDICRSRGMDFAAKVAEMFPDTPRSKLTLED